MASKKDTLVLGSGCISCAHNKDINLYKDMYKKSTEKIAFHAEEGSEFLKNLIKNPPRTTECRFYDSDAGLLCEYFVERDYDKDGSCPDYVAVKFEKAPVQRAKTVIDESGEDYAEGNVRELDAEDLTEVSDDEDYNE